MNTPNPFLPTPNRTYTAKDIQSLGKDRGATFYLTALNYAQTLWLNHFPAKSLLLINRALSCNLPATSLQHPHQPYHAVAWTLLHRPHNAFIGNPRRHYQHLATRMVEPHKNLRSWRAWACWHLACQILPQSTFPSDQKQILEENITEPQHHDIEHHLHTLTPNDDHLAWLSAIQWLSQQPHSTPPTIQPITIEDLPRIQTLAKQIWPLVYPHIISIEQIHYMLDTFYTLNLLRQEIRERHIQYAIIHHQNHDAGYLAWEPNHSNHTAFLHKLYLHPKFHSLGLGAQTLQWIHQQATAQNLHTITLRVNIHNQRAIRAYQRAGYQIHSPICSNIGNGYVMDDYFMTRPLQPTTHLTSTSTSHSHPSPSPP